MTDMVERVGRALDDAWNGEGKDLPPIELSRDERTYLARAAIEAMREPSDMMTYRGQAHRYESAWSIGAIWREMIDAALSQSGEG